MRESRRPLAALALIALTACPIEPLLPDAGTLDAGIDEACLQTSTADSGIHLGACDPATGTLCDVRNFQACTWDVLADEGVCTCSSQRVALGERCDLSAQNCELGSTCMFFQGDIAPSCQPVCRFDTGAGCEALEAPGRAVACAPVRRGADSAATTRFGICLDVGATCDPLNDDCPVNEKCSLLGRVTACGDIGLAGPGEECSNQACERGSLCVALADAAGNQVPATCYVPCQVSSPMCETGQCLDIGLDFGICF